MVGKSVSTVCRILNRSSCGSGSICGIRDGKSLIMTNAHVAGTAIGRIVTVEVESQGREQIQARVIQAGYSQHTWTDWAVLETVDPYSKVEPVKLSKNRPSGRHYTKGFPRCNPFPGSDINTKSLSTTDPRWLWQPDAISGQSGSGVWSYADHLQYGLLTWSIGTDGGGQMTSEIYRQARNCTVAGAPRVPGMRELDNFDIDYDTGDLDDPPKLMDGLHQQMSITSLPIWAEDDDGGPDIPPPNDDNDLSTVVLQRLMIEEKRQQIEALEIAIRKLQGIQPPEQGGVDTPGNPDSITFGLPKI